MKQNKSEIKSKINENGGSLFSGSADSINRRKAKKSRRNVKEGRNKIYIKKKYINTKITRVHTYYGCSRVTIHNHLPIKSE